MSRAGKLYGKPGAILDLVEETEALFERHANAWREAGWPEHEREGGALTAAGHVLGCVVAGCHANSGRSIELTAVLLARQIAEVARSCLSGFDDEEAKG